MGSKLIAGFTLAHILMSTGADARLNGQARYFEHVSKVKIGKEFFKVAKINRGGKLSEVIFNDRGQNISLPAFEKKMIAFHQKKGKINPRLKARLKRFPSQTTEVALWLNFEKSAPLSRPLNIKSEREFESVSKKIGSVHSRVQKQSKARKLGLLKKLGLSRNVTKSLEGSPAVIVKLKNSQILKLERTPSIGLIFPYSSKGKLDLSRVISVSGADDVHADGNEGDEIKVAVFEGCPDSTANLDIEASYSDEKGKSCTSTGHARHVTGIIKNTQTIDGMAPSSRTYSADSYDLKALDWAIDEKRVSVINQSFHRGAEIYDGMSFDDIYKDWKVLQYPWPTIVHAAGNWCASGTNCYEFGNDVTAEYVNHKGYNTISVGNHNDTAGAMSASSVFKNPSSPKGDRELPEIAGNGTNVTAVGLTMSGTSMASPAVVGGVALLQKQQPVLRFWPEGVRSLLFAGAVTNVSSHAGRKSNGTNASTANSTWWNDVRNNRDAYDGAGSMNIDESVEIAKNRYNGTAKDKGWQIGKLRKTDFNSSKYYKNTFKVKVENAEQRKIRVALAWNSVATLHNMIFWKFYTSYLGHDLDIRIFDSKGNQVASSLSYDNSYEIADFTGKVGETYTIKIHGWKFPNKNTWYSIAWNTY